MFIIVPSCLSPKYSIRKEQFVILCVFGHGKDRGMSTPGQFLQGYSPMVNNIIWVQGCITNPVFLKQEKYFFKTSQVPVIQVKEKMTYTLLAFYKVIYF